MKIMKISSHLAEDLESNMQPSWQQRECIISWTSLLNGTKKCRHLYWIFSIDAVWPRLKTFN